MRWMHQVSWAVLALGALLFTTTLVDAVPSRARGTLVLASAFMLGLVLFMHGRPWNRSSRRWTRGHCPRCNYDLKYEFGAGCPECGWRRQTV